MLRRTLTITAAALLSVVGLAGAARAHVELDPGEAVAGSTTVLTFSFHHGLDGTATTGLEVLLPEGTVVVDVPEVDGWTSAVDEVEGTVTWSGGSVPDGEDGIFPVEVTLPAEPGVVLFKTIQVTEAGELAWIEEDEGHDEGTRPAPRLTLVADPDAPTQSPDDPATDDPADDPTATTERTLPGTTLEAEQLDDGDSSLAPWLIGSGIVAAVAIAVGGYALKRRSG